MTSPVPSPAVDAQAVGAAVASELGTSCRAVTRLSGGYSTDNWRLDLASGRAVVARRYHPERSVCAVEAALLRRLAGVVPVAEVVLADPEGRLVGVPLLVTTFVEGVSARAVADEGPSADVADLARSAGATLAAIGSVRFPTPGFFTGADLALETVEPGMTGALRWVEATLDTATTVDAGLRDRWLRLLTTTAATVGPPRPAALTHSDYNPKNLLARRRPDGRWQVAAVLDWEFAFAGDPLADVGNWLRFAHRRPPEYRDAFLAGYRTAGGELPADWVARATVLDAMALADFLARGPGAAYYAEALALVERAVAVC